MEAYKMLALAVTAVLWTFWAVLKLRETDWSLIRGALDGFSRLGWLNRLVVLFFEASCISVGA